MTTTILRKHKPLDRHSTPTIDVSLLTRGDGTEVIHHRLERGTYWTLRPEHGEQALEYLYLLCGRLRWTSNDGILLESGDSLSACPVSEYVVLVAETDTEFLYISSRPQFQAYRGMLDNLRNLAVRIEELDGYTADHCQRIAALSMMVAERLRLRPKDQFDIQLGAFMHDVGKARVPDSVLNKPGKLTPKEWDIMKSHPLHGADMLKETGLSFLEGPGLIAAQHHERFDGSGYPFGLRGSHIHIGAAIVAVVDSYDAMTSDRVYRTARPQAEALAEIIQCRGKLYDPHVVDAFCAVIEEVALV